MVSNLLQIRRCPPALRNITTGQTEENLSFEGTSTALLYIDVCQGEGTFRVRKEKGTVPQSKEEGPAYQLVYILHYAAEERKSIELSAA